MGSTKVWGMTIHNYTENLTPCLEGCVCAVLTQVLRALQALPIRCRLRFRRRIKQLMQYPPFSIPPIKGFVQKALSSDFTYSNTYLVPFLGIATTFRVAALAGILLSLLSVALAW